MKKEEMEEIKRIAEQLREANIIALKLVEKLRLMDADWRALLKKIVINGAEGGT